MFNPDLKHVFTAESISTPLQEAVAVQLQDDAQEAADRLAQFRYNQAPVQNRGRTVGWVSLASLRKSNARVNATYQPLERSRFAGSAASISDVLPALATSGFCFTVGRSGLEGFIVPSDLDRHASRCHFYLLVAGVEMLLSQRLRADDVPEEAVSGAISDAPLYLPPGSDHEQAPRTLRERYEAARREDREVHPVEYLHLGSMIDLFREHASDVCDTQLYNDLRKVLELRPTVMHPTRALTAGGDTMHLAAVAEAAGRCTAALASPGG